MRAKLNLPVKILVANRGEIAMRVCKTAKKLGVQTVAIYSDADISSQHLQVADEAYRCGGAISSTSYLNHQSLLDIAKRTQVTHIHPGYGFVSENPDFVDLVTKAGIKFIGPPSEAMRVMGSKSQSKEIMNAAGVPTIPGYNGANQDAQVLAQEAAKIGYPVMIKAIKGGGGKGMRVVKS